MKISESTAKRHFVETSHGRISYLETGSGPVALFVHGVLLNGYLWRHQLDALADTRRCIAVDLLAHGDTETKADGDVSATANADMLAELLDVMKIDRVDLVGNDSGGGIAQIFAAKHPDQVRTLTLTDCDTHDNWPPEAFKPFLAMAAAGGLAGALDRMLADKSAFRSETAFGPAYERPDEVADETIEAYLQPLSRSEDRIGQVERFLAAFDCKHTVAIEKDLRALRAPTLIVWGTDDVFFPIEWADWLARTIPGPCRKVLLDGARLLFPEERWTTLNDELRRHWRSAR